MRRIPLFAFLMVGLLAFATPAPANSQAISPGDYVYFGNAACTLAYVFDGVGAQAGDVYFLTAAHCVRNVGQNADTQGFNDFGTVDYIGNANSNAWDFAFIKVKPAFHDKVVADVAGHPGVPTGYTTASETAAGDLVGFSGYGLGYEFTSVTRQERVGVLMSDNDSRWQVAGPYLNGDSGGPFFMLDSGKALGIESRVCLGFCTDTGPTIEGILAKAASQGFNVQLRTAS